MKIVTFWDKLNHLNLQTVAYKLISSKGWTTERTQLAISRYKLFLCLKSFYPAAMLVPTQEIDAVWHAHIEVNLLKYTQDCDFLFGYLLNHCSAIEQQQNEETHLIYEQAFGTTKVLFEEFFGLSLAENTSLRAACADIPIDNNPAPCADLPINNNVLLGNW